MLETGKLYRVKEYDKNTLWMDILTHSYANGIVDEDDIFCIIEFLPLNCIKVLTGDGRVGWIYIHPSNIMSI